MAGKCYKRSRKSGQGLPRDAVKEIALLVGLSDEHIIATRGTFTTPTELWCLMECAAYGNLRDFASSSAKEMVRQAEAIALQMMSGIAYLHSRNVVHRDIKPENLLVFAVAPKILVKISDLGSALVHGCTQPMQPIPRTDPISTLWYRSPEIALGLTDMHGSAMDMWAAGLVVCELCHPGCPVFGHVSNESDLIAFMCYKFGRPSVSNDVMPSYNRAKLAGRILSFVPNIQTTDVPPYLALWYPAWANAILRGTLVMEPTRRISAADCARLLNPQCDAVCPKTPKAIRGPKREAYASALRALAGDILFESCVHSDFDRRTFHAAARILDKACEDPSCLTEDRLPVVCAAAASIASKLCETAGINPNWGPDLRNHSVSSGKAPRGLGRFDLSVSDIEAEELHILNAREWDVWDVLVIDIPVPSRTDVVLYAFVCDILVSHMGTAECTPHDLSEVAVFLVDCIVDPKSQKVFPASLMKILDMAVDTVGSVMANRSPVKIKYATICERLLGDEIQVDSDTIKWV